MKTYDELFEVRGSAYDRAMWRYPRARDEEFRQAIDQAQLSPGMVVADVPAGGGYLQAYLPPDCHWRGHEPCASFTHHGDASSPAAHRPLLPLPWSDHSIDVAISLAGVHHLEDKRPLFADLHRVVKSGGRLVLSDVAAASAVAHFLDGFVGAHNSTGHEGVFLDDRTDDELRETGWRILSSAIVPMHWLFADRPAMVDFCQNLFDLCRATPQSIEKAIVADLGIAIVESGQTAMNWSLRTIVAENR